MIEKEELEKLKSYQQELTRLQLRLVKGGISERAKKDIWRRIERLNRELIPPLRGKIKGS